jgi:alpha-tubulin suppressor-like RCC1 family protein
MRTCLRRLIPFAVLLGCAVADAAADTAARVSTGDSHSCAVNASGGVLCWGDNTYNQLGDGTTTNRATPTPVSGLGGGVIAVSAGGSHSCAITSTGAVYCWGENSAGQLGDGTTTQRATPTLVPAIQSGATAIATGSAHSCAVTTGGAAKCWGFNIHGELGDGTTVEKHTPVAVSGLTSGVTRIVAGASFTCALKTGSAVVCWGDGSLGQIGNSSLATRTTPVQVTGLTSGVDSVAAGGGHACAVTTLGALSCWGYNGVGQIGDNTKTNRLVPTAVIGMSSGVASIGLGQAHTCAVTTGGALKCWGSNEYAQVGDGTATDRLTATQVAGLTSGSASVSGGQMHTCALSTAGEIRCWGSNEKSQLGLGSVVVQRRLTPWPLSSFGSGLATVALGQRHACGLTTTGGVKCWGANQFGQLGDGAPSTFTRPVPADVTGLTSGVTAIAVGAFHSCALITGGAVKCWGSNSVGQLGDNTVTDRSVPTQVSSLTSGVAAIAVGDSHSCALTTTGAVKCWGANWYGQIGDNSVTNRGVPTQVSGMTTGVAAVSVFGYHTCARTTTGGAKCWGYNAYGQLGDNTAVDKRTPVAVSGLSSGVLAIASGFEFSCALMTGSVVKCWGKNDFNQLGDGSTTNRPTPTAVSNLPAGVASLSVGSAHACVVTSGGALSCWGLNTDGELGDGTTTNRASPAAVSGLSNGVAQTSLGSLASCAVTTGGAGLCWGGVAFYGIFSDGVWPIVSGPVKVYNFGGSPTVTGIAPATGPADGGTAVRIIGSYLLTGATVLLGGTPATGVTVINPNEIAATTGAHAAGAVAVVVRNPDAAEASLPGGYTYTGGTSTPTFTEDPLVVRTTTVKVTHIAELRQYVNDLRARFSLGAFAWTNATLTSRTALVRSIDVAELRIALDEAYSAAGRGAPTYTDATLVPGVTIVTATHIAELRAAVLALW